MLFCGRSIKIGAKQTNINKMARSFFLKQEKNQINSHKVLKKNRKTLLNEKWAISFGTTQYILTSVFGRLSH